MLEIPSSTITGGKEIQSDQHWDLLPAVDSFTEEFEQAENVECLRKSISNIADKDRELINLKYITEMKYKEIADMFWGNGGGC